MKAWFMRQSPDARGGILIAAVGTAMFLFPLMILAVESAGADKGACGTGAPEWAQSSAEACAAFEAQYSEDAGAPYGQQEYQRERSEQFREEQRARQNEYKDNYNCQVGPMFCPR